ncbi:hypothetical protein [Legionella sp. W05-934-2]|uniref:hypothetical protein n=1 Tax=Legionella sp. W05-934-2 TaxID=1198649 RepID=UPI003462B7AB
MTRFYNQGGNMSITYNESDRCLTAYSELSKTDWDGFFKKISTDDSIEAVYFHYTDYHGPESDLLKALTNAPNLKAVWIKGSTFHFSESGGDHFIKVLEELKKCPKLEHVLIRNQTALQLDQAFESLAGLIEKSSEFKKLTIWHQEISGEKFKLLCDALSKSHVQIELDFTSDVSLSPKNRALLKCALNSNPKIKVSKNIETMLKDVDSTLGRITLDRVEPATGETDKAKVNTSNVYMPVLSGFIAGLGVASVAVAFTLLNASSLGLVGLVVAGVGVAAVLTSVGMFGMSSYKATENAYDSSVSLQPAF